MHTEPKKIIVPPDSDLARLLKDAGRTGEPLLVDTGDMIYSLRVGPSKRSERPTPATAPASHPSAEEVALSQEGIRNAAGSWKDIDVEAFKAYVAERRHASSRPPVRL